MIFVYFTSTMLIKSIVMGMAPITLLSTAVVSHVVQPRFDSPLSTNLSILFNVCDCTNSTTVSYFEFKRYIIFLDFNRIIFCRCFFIKELSLVPLLERTLLPLVNGLEQMDRLGCQ